MTRLLTRLAAAVTLSWSSASMLSWLLVWSLAAPVDATRGAPPTRPVTQPAIPVGWTTVFADAPWYREAKATREGLYRGTLRRTKGKRTMAAADVKIVYELGAFPVQTQGENVPILDALVGRRVEIRGRRVRVEASSKIWLEIWPAAVRDAAPPRPSPPHPKPPGSTSPKAPAKWTTLFADQRWYKARRGTERVFSGTLEAVPGAGRPSTLMRTSHYRLGDRTIYTRARKHPALDALVGKPVQIRGKGVEMNLEGRSLKEIWPAAIRPNSPGTPSANPPGKPPAGSPSEPATNPAGKPSADPPGPGGKPIDPRRLARAQLVVRGKRVESISRRYSPYRSDGIEIQQVFKAPPGFKPPPQLYLRVPAKSHAVPKKECTIYLLRRGTKWVLLGDATEAVSHVAQ